MEKWIKINLDGNSVSTIRKEEKFLEINFHDLYCGVRERTTLEP